jgi:hypothetical protein
MFNDFGKFMKEWAGKRDKNVCKPCWELHYCPYGPLVEEFPIPTTREQMKEIIAGISKNLREGVYQGEQKQRMEKLVAETNPEDYPVKIPRSVEDKTCDIFGHMCPVFFVSEPLGEFDEPRVVTRKISRTVILRVARRDNNTCQICGTHLLDGEIEFDHIIPVSKGGMSNEANVRVTCLDCNRKKGAKRDMDI